MKYWLVLLFTLGYLAEVNTFQCYQCQNDLKSGCSDPFDRNSMTDTDKVTVPVGSACMKAKGTKDGVAHVQRSAVPLFAALVCEKGLNSCFDKTEDGVKVTLCCCDSDLCNGATTVQQRSHVVYAIFGGLAMIAYRLFW